MKVSLEQTELFQVEITKNQHWGERWALSNGWELVAGVDEVGRGCLAGPVVAAAVILPFNHGIIGLKDSKILSRAKREKLFGEIIKKGCCASSSVSNSRIDRINILRATMEAMARSIVKLCRKMGRSPECILIDGLQVPGRELLGMDVRCIPVRHGDCLSENIAAASILAKVVRDGMMRRYELMYSGYGFSQHKGYGTRRHYMALKKLGPCPIHRLTFSDVVSGR